MANRTLARRKLTKAAIGEMRDRISLERRTTVPPNFGEPENTIQYVVIAEVWSKVDSITYVAAGDREYNGVNINKSPALRFTIRFRDDIDFSSVAIRWRGKLYEIDLVGDPEERNEYTYLTSILRGDASEQANQ